MSIFPGYLDRDYKMNSALYYTPDKYSYQLTELNTLPMFPTKREREVLSKLCEGYSSKEIASFLFISRHTVEAHKRKLMSKLNARNTVHLAVLAERQGLLSTV